ncbi:MAG: TetR/AcrR family transcriptional regulator [Actinoallomurus sp.]
MSPAPDPGPNEPATLDGATLRADARRNHERVIAAAIEVFSEYGLDATVPAVAARAGVGKATVYRSYPTKADLIAAVAAPQALWLERRVADALRDQDAYAALSGLLRDIAVRLSSDRLFVEVLPQAGFQNLGETFTRQMEQLVDAAREQGSLRPDITYQDIKVLMGGASRVLTDMGVRDPGEWRRYTDLVLAALRP